MNTAGQPSANGQPRVKKISEPMSVSVFNCLLLVGKEADSGQFAARCATLDGVVGHGKSERDALRDAIAAFKVRVARVLAAEETIPWLDRA